MTSLTTRQRDLVQVLVETDTPITVATIAQKLQLTPRQVSYGLKGVHSWLSQFDVTLSILPSVGVSLEGNDAEIEKVAQALHSEGAYQLVLSVSQRQQLFIFRLLTTSSPLILYQLQQSSLVSRTTILKDLDAITPWIESFGLTLERRPNYGIEVFGIEKARRQAIVALLWGDNSPEDALWQMTHTVGLTFSLAHDATLLPILEEVVAVLDQIEADVALERVFRVESRMEGRLSDVSILHLALVLAVQQQRVRNGHWLEEDSAEYLQNHPIWSSAQRLFSAQLIAQHKERTRPEIANIAAHLVSNAYNAHAIHDLNGEANFADLISHLMEIISSSYRMPNILQDETLRSGLNAHIVPAYLRHQFGLWSPPQYSNRLPETYTFELSLADTLSAFVLAQTNVTLPPHEVNNLALLIRAAYLREQPNKVQQVIVVCPSGMATAQLLTARLKAQFPRLGTVEMLSFRELTQERIDSAELIITTVPIPHDDGNTKIIQVHPLLNEEDIDTIQQWFA